MTTAETPAGALLDVSGPAAPPRRNGELVFDEPWESRAFGLAVGLHACGVFEWEAFRQQLIAAIARWEAHTDPAQEWSYYRCWLEALEVVLAAEGLVSVDDVERRATELAARPEGHDHAHSHDSPGAQAPAGAHSSHAHP